MALYLYLILMKHICILVSSNNPKNVHAINETSPSTKDMMAKINSPKKRTAIAIVMKIKEKIK